MFHCVYHCVCREKKLSRTSALKVLDHSMIGPEGTDNCHKFVDILGLRTIFPLFMKTPKKMRKTGVSDKEHEGIVITSSSFSPCSKDVASVLISLSRGGVVTVLTRPSRGGLLLDSEGEESWPPCK